MDKYVVNENVSDNSKKLSLAGFLIVHWQWNRDKNYRTFLGLRMGGKSETRYDLELKYKDNEFEKETVLTEFEQLADYSLEEKREKILEILEEEEWRWDPEQNFDFEKEVDDIVN